MSSPRSLPKPLGALPAFWQPNLGDDDQPGKFIRTSTKQKKNVMGLFDKILGGQSSETATLSKQDAVAAILLITVAADGHISNEEAEGIVAISNRMNLLKSQTADDFNAMMRRLQGHLQKHGMKWLLGKAADAMPRELRETAFALSADMVFADGNVEEEEKSVLEAIQVAMQVPDELAIKIIEVLQIKNRG